VIFTGISKNKCHWPVRVMVPHSLGFVIRLLQVVPQYHGPSNRSTGSGIVGGQGYPCLSQRELRQPADSSGIEKARIYDKPEHYCQNHVEEPYQGEVFQKIPLHYGLESFFACGHQYPEPAI
jgi:hypothetical protein